MVTARCVGLVGVSKCCKISPKNFSAFIRERKREESFTCVIMPRPHGLALSGGHCSLTELPMIFSSVIRWSNGQRPADLAGQGLLILPWFVHRADLLVELVGG